MNAIVTGPEAHGPIIACVEYWENAGRYDDRGTAWGWRLELRKDGTVYRRRCLFHREQGRAFLRRQLHANLDRMLKERGSWKDFAEEWLSMQRNLEPKRDVVEPSVATKDK